MALTELVAAPVYFDRATVIVERGVRKVLAATTEFSSEQPCDLANRTIAPAADAIAAWKGHGSPAECINVRREHAEEHRDCINLIPAAWGSLRMRCA